MDNSIAHHLLCLLVQVKNGKKAYVGVLTLWTVGIKYEQSSMQTVFQCFFLFFFAGKDKTVRYKWKLNV